MRVQDWMTTNLEVVSPEDTLLHARTLMRQRKMRHLPVMADSRLVGILSDRDLRDYSPSKCTPCHAQEEACELDAMSVGEVMQRVKVGIHPKTPLNVAAARLLQARVGCLPVIEGGRLVGMLTTTDLLRSIAERPSEDQSIGVGGSEMVKVGSEASP